MYSRGQKCRTTLQNSDFDSKLLIQLLIKECIRHIMRMQQIKNICGYT